MIIIKQETTVTEIFSDPIVRLEDTHMITGDNQMTEDSQALHDNIVRGYQNVIYVNQ